MANEHPVYNFRYDATEFHYDSANRRLMRGTKHLKLERMPREMLAFLLRNPDRLVTYDELKKSVWKAVSVEDGSIHAAVAKIRSALRREQPGTDSMIETHRGEGIWFLAKVEIVTEPPPPRPSSSIETKSDFVVETTASPSAALARPITRTLAPVNDSELETFKNRFSATDLSN